MITNAAMVRPTRFRITITARIVPMEMEANIELQPVQYLPPGMKGCKTVLIAMKWLDRAAHAI